MEKTLKIKGISDISLDFFEDDKSEECVGKQYCITDHDSVLPLHHTLFFLTFLFFIFPLPG